MRSLIVSRATWQRFGLWLFRQVVMVAFAMGVAGLVTGLFGSRSTALQFVIAIGLWACLEWLHLKWATKNLAIVSAHQPAIPALEAGETFWVDLGGPSSRETRPRRFPIPMRFAWMTLREKEIEFAITEYGKRVTIRWDLGEHAIFHFQPLEMSGKQFLWLCRIEHTCPRIVTPLWISGGNLEAVERAVRKFGYPTA